MLKYVHGTFPHIFRLTACGAGEICFACSGRDYAPSVFRLQGNFFFEGKHLFKREFCYL